MFVDESGFANIGVGYALDRNFPFADLGACFRRFIATLSLPKHCAAPSDAEAYPVALRLSTGRAHHRRPGDAGGRRGQSGRSAERRRYP